MIQLRSWAARDSQLQIVCVGVISLRLSTQTTGSLRTYLVRVLWPNTSRKQYQINSRGGQDGVKLVTVVVKVNISQTSSLVTTPTTMHNIQRTAWCVRQANVENANMQLNVVSRRKSRQEKTHGAPVWRTRECVAGLRASSCCVRACSSLRTRSRACPSLRSNASCSSLRIISSFSFKWAC